MSFEHDLRVAVLGATGALGGELLRVLEEQPLPVRELLPLASEESFGEAVTFKGEELSVYSGYPDLTGVDVLFLCAPPEVWLEFVRQALEKAVFAIDLSGALADTSEVPLLLSCVESDAKAIKAPLIATPSSAALIWASILRPLQVLGLRRAVGTVLESVGGSGREGLDALSGEALALFGQRELPEPGVFSKQIAFDCLPAVGPVDDAGVSLLEQRLHTQLQRLLGNDLGLGIHSVQVPTFAGQGLSLAVDLAPDVTLERLTAVLREAPGIELWQSSELGPTLREALGSDDVLIGRLRPEPSTPGCFLLWAVGDPLRLCALNAVELALERFLRD